MDRPLKIMLGISAALLVIFAAVLTWDYLQFQQNLPQIIEALGSDEPGKLDAAWFSVVVFRSLIFLVPALIFGASALIMHIHENRVPKPRR